jgi:hypothetical protein
VNLTTRRAKSSFGGKNSYLGFQDGKQHLAPGLMMMTWSLKGISIHFSVSHFHTYIQSFQRSPPLLSSLPGYLMLVCVWFHYLLRLSRSMNPSRSYPMLIFRFHLLFQYLSCPFASSVSFISILTSALRFNLATALR